MPRPSQLHEFDLDLCDHVWANLSSVWRNTRYADVLRIRLQKERSGGRDPLPEYVLQRFEEEAAEGRSQPHPSLLLSDDELLDLSLDLQDFPRDWVPDEPLYNRGVLCIDEIRRRIAPNEADVWSQRTREWARELLSGALTVSEGIEVIHHWCMHIRRLLAAMSRLDLVPRPDGEFPTPTMLTGRARELVSDVDPVDVQMVMEAVQQLRHEQGKDAKAETVARRAGIRSQTVRKILRDLQKRGEYSGFTRAEPTRRSADESPGLAPDDSTR